jgi:thymidylate synthase
MFIKASNVDDLLRHVLTRLLRGGSRIRPTRGAADELTAVLLCLTRPRSRLSRTEAKGKVFSCLGELLWYLSPSDDLGFISTYLSHYIDESDDGKTIYGAYGPRLFGLRRQNQINNVVRLLTRNPYSRRAVIQLFDAVDLAQTHKHIPCTCTLQFLVRRGRLHLLTNMRSNDAFLGLAHDIFAFTMLQEIVARRLRVDVGHYFHVVGSLHLYRRHVKRAKQFLREGWQSDRPMRPMPAGDPQPAVRKVLAAEAAIRAGKTYVIPKNLHAYWADLIRLVAIYRCFREGRTAEIAKLKSDMSSRIFDVYIDDKRLRSISRRAELEPTKLKRLDRGNSPRRAVRL